MNTETSVAAMDKNTNRVSITKPSAGGSQKGARTQSQDQLMWLATLR